LAYIGIVSKIELGAQTFEIPFGTWNFFDPKQEDIYLINRQSSTTTKSPPPNASPNTTADALCLLPI